MNTEERTKALNNVLQVIWNPEEKILLRGKANELSLIRLEVEYNSLTIQQLADYVNELRADPALRIYGLVNYRWPTDLINMKVKFYYLGTSQVWIRRRQTDLDHADLIRAIGQSRDFLNKTMETDESLIKNVLEAITARL